MVQPEGLVDLLAEDRSDRFDDSLHGSVNAFALIAEDNDYAKALALGEAADTQPVSAFEAIRRLAEYFVQCDIIFNRDDATRGVGLPDDCPGDVLDQKGIGLGIKIEIGAEGEFPVHVGQIDRRVDRTDLLENPFHGFAEETFDFDFLAEGLLEFACELREVELLRHFLIGPHQIVTEQVNLLTDLVPGLVELLTDLTKADISFGEALDVIAALRDSIESAFEVGGVDGGHEHVGSAGAPGLDADVAAALAGHGDEFGVGIFGAEVADEFEAGIVVDLNIHKKDIGGALLHLGLGLIDAGGNTKVGGSHTILFDKFSDTGVGIDNQDIPDCGRTLGLQLHLCS